MRMWSLTQMLSAPASSASRPILVRPISWGRSPVVGICTPIRTNTPRFQRGSPLDDTPGTARSGAGSVSGHRFVKVRVGIEPAFEVEDLCEADLVEAAGRVGAASAVVTDDD